MSQTAADPSPPLQSPRPDLVPLLRHMPGPLPPPVLARLAAGWAEDLAELQQSGERPAPLYPGLLTVSPDLSQGRLGSQTGPPTGAESAAEVAVQTATYLAPEQGGPGAPPADARADLYAFGVILYELATGTQPFAGADAAACRHLHLTHRPAPARSLTPDLPAPLSDLIARLLAKDPADRPASFAEVRQALAGCLPPPRLWLDDQLFGQDDGLARLSRQVDEGLAGTTPCLLRVVGPSGAGKSTLVARALQALPPQTLVLQGKFEQLDRGQPYLAFLAAFDMALLHMLAGAVADRDLWRSRLLEALSPNARVLLDILPRYKALIGAQPPVPELGLNEAQIRVSLVFRRFLAVLARAEAPLVLVLDDVQWADAASIALMRLILTDLNLRHVVLVAVYRDTEVGPDHPFARMLHEIEHLPPPVSVRALQGDEVARLIAAALGAAPADTAALAAIITRKTEGNPYFIRQFLLRLVRTGGIVHDPQAGHWRWDADRAQAEAFTDNVLDLVVERIMALSPAAQRLVQIGTCIGTEFDTALLARCADLPAAAVTAELVEAVAADVLCVAARGPDGSVTRYRVLHDRVGQAAIALIDPATRAALHARLGALMLQDDPQGSQTLLQTTDHLIRGLPHLDPALTSRLRDLALASAARSMASNAYEAALDYYRAAARTVTGEIWQAEPGLAFLIALDSARIAYLLGRTAAAEAEARALLTRDLAVLDRVAVLELIILLHNSELRYPEAIAVGDEALRLLDAAMPMKPGMLRVLASFALTKFAGRKLTDAQFLALPRLADPRKLAVLRVLVLLAPPAYFTSQTLLPLMMVRAVRMSMRHGNGPDTPFAISIYGMLHAFVLGRPRRAVALAELARDMIPRVEGGHIAARVMFNDAGFIRHWAGPLTDSLAIYATAIREALAAGEVEWHGYCRYGHGSYALMAGLPLDQVTADLEEHLAAVTAVRHEKTQRIMTMALNSLYSMQGRVFPQAFDEAANTAIWAQGNDGTSLAYFHKYKMLEAQMRGDAAEVFAQATAMRTHDNGTASMAYQPFYKFYLALALIELSAAMPLPRRVWARVRAGLLRRHLDRLARLVPQTHAHRALLIAAEQAAARGRTARAVMLFDQAVARAQAACALHDVGLGMERAGLFYLRQGAQAQGRDLLQKAIAAYHHWGGSAWARHLAQRHPALGLNPAPPATALGQPATPDGDLMLRAASSFRDRAGQAELLPDVLGRLVETTGALRGVLLLPREGELLPMAEAGPPTAAAPGYPVALANLVFGTAETVVLAEAHDAAEGRARLAQDPYLAALRPLSALCAPLVVGGSAVGVVYLEHPHQRGTFTPERVRLVEVLGTQAALALQNAGLLDQLRGALERQVDLTSAHARFVPHGFLDLLGRPSILDVRLGDHVRGTSSILFADMRGFTPQVEAMPHDRVMDFVNGFLARMEPPVRESNGFIDSFVGDAVMAVFDRGAEAAVTAGIAMLRALQGWQGPSGGAIQIGIGVATGELIFATMGSVSRLQCGVLGDTVNLAARVESLTKSYGLSFLVTGSTLANLPDPGLFWLREVDRVTVVGRDAPVVLHEVFDADPEPLRLQKRRAAPAIAEGLAAYRAGDLTGAAAAFARARGVAPDDPLPGRLLARCNRDSARPRDATWTGTERMLEK